MISKSGRKIYNPEAHHKTTQIAVSKITREENIKNRAIANLARHNSPEEKIWQSGRDIAQQLDKTKQLLAAAMKNLTVTTLNDVLNFITTEINATQNSKKRDNYIQPNVSLEQIQEVINDCMPLLKQLRTICFDDEIAKFERFLKPKYKGILFDKLIEVDARFALFAPKGSLNDANLAVDSRVEFLPEELQLEIKALKEKLELDENLDYVATTEIVNSEIKTERQQTVNSMLDKLQQNILNAKLEVAKATKFLSDNLCDYIVNQLELEIIDEDKKLEEIKQVLDMCRQGLNALKITSETKNIREVAGWKELDPNTELFNRLMKINIKFAFFAPKKSLNRLDIDFKRLSEQDRNDLQSVLLGFKLWDNDEFYENYKDLFNVEKRDDYSI